MGWALIPGWALIKFSTYRVGASRWALNRINPVIRFELPVAQWYSI